MCSGGAQGRRLLRQLVHPVAEVEIDDNKKGSVQAKPQGFTSPSSTTSNAGAVICRNRLISYESAKLENGIRGRKSSDDALFLPVLASSAGSCWQHQVGEWEVKHALRQGEEELRGKDLATREQIEELLVTVRRESSGCQPPTSNLIDGFTSGQVILAGGISFLGRTICLSSVHRVDLFSPRGILQLQSYWSLSCDHGLVYGDE